MADSTRVTRAAGRGIGRQHWALSLFADAVPARPPSVNTWTGGIPADGRPDLVDALEQLDGPRGRRHRQANAEAVRRLDQSVPLWWTSARPRPSSPSCPAERCCTADPRSNGPRSATRSVARCGPPAVAEGWAESVEEADRILADGTVTLQPAYRYDTVMPMASAIGPSAPMFAVDNRDGGTRRVRPDQPGPGGDRVVRRETPAAIAGWSSCAMSPGPMLRQVLDSPVRSTSSPWPPKASRSATTCTCGPRARPT
jgi:hypothetical protein